MLDAEPKYVRNPKRFVGKEGKLEFGSLQSNGAYEVTLAPKDSADSEKKSSTVVPSGYHNGKGALSIQDLATATRDTDATKDEIYTGKSALVKGEVVNGVATISNVSSFVWNSSNDSTIYVNWTNPSGGLYNGVRIVYQEGSTAPESPTGSAYVDTTGTTYVAGAVSIGTISGLKTRTAYALRIYPYANVNGEQIFGESAGTTSGSTTCSSHCSCDCNDTCYKCSDKDPCPGECHCNGECAVCTCDGYGPGCPSNCTTDSA